MRLVLGERGVQVGEIGLQGLWVEPADGDVGQTRRLGGNAHQRPPDWLKKKS